MLNVVRPVSFVPVHGEYRHLAAHAELARMAGVKSVEICEDGDMVIIEGDETRVEAGRCRPATSTSTATASAT